ncbi:hypothetical protein KY290_001666 [Solanum tuberosum]|uniref:Uncharacterized protein n=1 Tax=Solanum tuberosum TaxID=4113 RepID=A0ABQ7WPT7_SOLTU|nr:hypothetical protein KY284_001704 [Solanum tuberosum]KAH0782068.1 hypothetical protein KY290_001666 [Solanum tuberosum]
MTCGNCSAVDYNRRRCPLLQKGKQVLPDVPVSAPQPIDKQASNQVKQAPGPSKSKRKNVSKDKVDAVPKRSKNSGKEKVVAPSIAIVDEVEGGIESEDDDTLVAPRVIFEAKTRLQMKKLQQQPIGSRKISFRGDKNCVAIPTNLPYSPKKLTWKGKACVTSNQLTKD